MNNAVGRLSHALDASREEQGLCPHVKNPAFDAGLVFSVDNFPTTGKWHDKFDHYAHLGVDAEGYYRIKESESIFQYGQR